VIVEVGEGIPSDINLIRTSYLSSTAIC
jgi:hypothetical protein